MSLLLEPPSVFVVRDEYWICTLSGAECTMGAEVGGRTHWDHSGGTLCSRRTLGDGVFLHMARVPQAALDAARCYTLRLRRIVERKPYFTECGEETAETFGFRPVSGGRPVRIVNLADAHSLVDEPVAAARACFGGAPDLLILNGDIPDHSGDAANFASVYRIAGRVTGGAAPCVFARGNHDMRGCSAERLEAFVPSDGGRPYFVFRAGPVGGIVLDTAEDKPDDHPEYGHTICAHDFRLEEDAFLDGALADPLFRDAALKLVVSHKPLAHEQKPPFDIEKDLYRSWCARLRAAGPHLLLTGHLHECFVEKPGGAHDSYGQPCLHVCSSRLRRNPPRAFVCGAIAVRLRHGAAPSVTVRFVDHEGVSELAYDGPAEPCHS